MVEGGIGWYRVVDGGRECERVTGGREGNERKG